MQHDPIERLSEKQRECLRMVYRHMETKEIARALGLSPDGVTQRIKAAMRTLNVERRRDAARILAEVENAGSGSPLVYQPDAPDLDINPSDLPTKTVRAPNGELVRMKVVKEDSKTLAGDLLAAFRSNVRSILNSRRRKADDVPDATQI